MKKRVGVTWIKKEEHLISDKKLKRRVANTGTPTFFFVPAPSQVLRVICCLM